MWRAGAQGSREAAERQERLIAQVEERRMLRATVVPTDVAEVKLLLRRLGEPITLFGERPVRISYVTEVPASRANKAQR